MIDFMISIYLSMSHQIWTNQQQHIKTFHLTFVIISRTQPNTILINIQKRFFLLPICQVVSIVNLFQNVFDNFQIQSFCNHHWFQAIRSFKMLNIGSISFTVDLSLFHILKWAKRNIHSAYIVDSLLIRKINIASLEWIPILYLSTCICLALCEQNINTSSGIRFIYAKASEYSVISFDIFI